MKESEDVQHLEVLPLVFVDALDDDIEHRCGIDGDSRLVVDIVGERSLTWRFTCAPFRAEVGVVGGGFEAQDFSMVEPAVADLAVMSADFSGWRAQASGVA